MIKEAISTISQKRSLTREQACEVMNEIMEGQTTPSQLAAFLTALSIKGEHPDEIAGLASVMRAKALPVRLEYPLLDIVGTGGDGLNTFNISTAAALVVAAAGVKVAKHGNRAASGKCGSADVLEKLGVKISLTPAQVESCIREVGIGFMFAAAFHPAMKYAAGTRREIGIRTVFNLLGPLTNPAAAEYMLLGVPNAKLAEKMIPALKLLPFKHVLVVSAKNGMDEITTADCTQVWELRQANLVSNKTITPEEFNLKRCDQSALSGGSAEENAAIINHILDGQPGAAADVVVFNAGAALYTAERARTLAEGIETARETLTSGSARTKLNELIRISNSF
jgi:anthranilate phosphoribosyltransferase